MRRDAIFPAPGRLSRALVFVAGRRLAFFAAIWTILTGGESLLAGVAVALAATWLSLRLLAPKRPVRLLPLFAMIPGFIQRSLLGGIDVARRALHPTLPLDPGWVAVDSNLPDGGKVALGGELSLMPGTLAGGSDHGRLLVHVLDREQDVERAVRDEEAWLVRVAGSAWPPG